MRPTLQTLRYRPAMPRNHHAGKTSSGKIRTRWNSYPPSGSTFSMVLPLRAAGARVATAQSA